MPDESYAWKQSLLEKVLLLKEHRPVSYTHLDVYKRQAKDWASGGKIVNAMNKGDTITLYYDAPQTGEYTVTVYYSCLLYTSRCV